MEDKLEEYGLEVRESDNPERQLIDFDISDEEDNVAWVWGDSPEDAEVECDHPYQCIEWGDDDERGVCLLCGATCDWHYENQVVSEGHDEDGRYTCQTADVRVPHDWYMPRKASGMIGEYIEQLRKLIDHAELV